MLGKFKDKGWFGPLAVHCLVHFSFTIVIGLFCKWVPFYIVLLMGIFDFWMHLFMDRIKASRKMLGRFKPLNAMEYTAMKAAADGKPIGAPYPVEEAKKRLKSNWWFWLSIGIDQGFHHLTHYVIILIFYLFSL